MFKRIGLAATLVLLLQGQSQAASLKELSNTLTVYPDNRVGYVFTGAGGANPTRVWSNGDQVLALRVKDRLINVIDIDTVSVKYTGQGRSPLVIAVTLRNGDAMSANVADWGGEVEWAACSSAKVCEYPERGPTRLSFPSFPTFLNAVTDASIETAVRELVSSGRQVTPETVVPSNSLGNALPLGLGSYKLTFSTFDEVSDTQGAIQKERERRLALKQCVSDEVRAAEIRLKEQEVQFVRGAPSGREAEWREQWLRSSPSFSTLLSQSEMLCKRKHQTSR